MFNVYSGIWILHKTLRLCLWRKRHCLEHNERCSALRMIQALPVWLCGQEGSHGVTPERWSVIGQRRMWARGSVMKGLKLCWTQHRRGRTHQLKHTQTCFRQCPSCFIWVLEITCNVLLVIITWNDHGKLHSNMLRTSQNTLATTYNILRL